MVQKEIKMSRHPLIYQKSLFKQKKYSVIIFKYKNNNIRWFNKLIKIILIIIQDSQLKLKIFKQLKISIIQCAFHKAYSEA